MYILQNIIEFESIWSIVEKFKYNNVINGKEFNELISANTTYERNDYVLNLTPTKTKQLDNLLNFSTYDYETKVRKKILGNIITDSPLQLKMVFSENLKYCPLCLKGGYHSYFHQLNFVYKCPFHLIELIDHCSKCKAKIKYRIIVTNTQPYNCNCGYPLIDGIEEKFSKIKNTNTLDSINSFYAWINSPLKNNENIKIYPLIGCIDVRSLNDYKHLFINGSNINKNIIHKNYFSAIKKTKIDFNGKNIMGRGELRNLYKQSKSIYSSIVKYKKKIFQKKICMKLKY
ncbi:hypothetical protein PGC35_19390 [Psychrobacillus sp. PGGUH221]|uniref:hypothetical protein n=1 Tax=Psychrobacillus sp. PGGUH221 TaxID=3020058 RepID=UPI0035C736E6